ncbi:MAG TPA: dihydropteroate synthase [Candidatus Saccharimonadia bacterium]|jgi:dihydropteroate synthase|nr:dihydropteroate synthase [Candidatus Saccharimonadia bacterium]
MKLVAKNTTIDLSQPKIMGVLNVTPDSFSGDGVVDTEAAVAYAGRMIDEGAAIIDVGGESSRPGAAPVSEAEELSRVVPVIKRLARIPKLVISIDTYKPAVAEAALKAGAHIVNDITGLSDRRMAELVAKTGAGVVIMHMKGTPQTMQTHPQYDDVVAEVIGFLEKRVEVAKQAGVGEDHIMLDPGIGFGKTLEHNLVLLRELPKLINAFTEPFLIGVSRKSMIGMVTGREAPVDRVYGTVALTALAVRDGARIVRVHDVAANRDAVAMAQALYGQK